MDAATAAALTGSVGSAWARLGSLLLLLCGRGSEAVRVLDAACGAADGGGPLAGVECAKAHSQLGAADPPALGPDGSPAVPRWRGPRLTPHLDASRLDAAPGALHALLHGSRAGSSSTPEMAVRGLQQAIALGRSDAGGGGGDDLQLPLLNLLALYDSTKQHESASRAAAFLVAATRPRHLPLAAPAPATTPDASVPAARDSMLDSHVAPARLHPDVQRPLGWWLAVQRASVRSGEPAPLWVLWEAHARPGVLGARYLQARTHLLCGRWEEASKELQALLPLLPQLRCALRSFGVSDVAMLQQTVSRARLRARPTHPPTRPLTHLCSRALVRSHP